MASTHKFRDGRVESRKFMGFVMQGFLHFPHLFNLKFHFTFLFYLLERGGVRSIWSIRRTQTQLVELVPESLKLWEHGRRGG
jgi:hypothetical protein